MLGCMCYRAPCRHACCVRLARSNYDEDTATVMEAMLAAGRSYETKVITMADLGEMRKTQFLTMMRIYSSCDGGEAGSWQELRNQGDYYGRQKG
eukprot:1161037-Pelagomonas_calceolata.AAC.7